MSILSLSHENNHDYFTLARYTIIGILDDEFGSGGVITTPIGNFASAYDVDLQPDGKIVTAGVGLQNIGGQLTFALARYFGDETGVNPILPTYLPTLLKN